MYFILVSTLPCPICIMQSTNVLVVLFVGCVFHSFVSLPGSGGPFGPRSHSAWSFRWDCLLPKARLVKTWRSTGKVLNSYTVMTVPCVCKNYCNTFPCGRFGLMQALKFSSLTPSDLVH